MIGTAKILVRRLYLRIELIRAEIVPGYFVKFPGRRSCHILYASKSWVCSKIRHLNRYEQSMIRVVNALKLGLRPPTSAAAQ
jgi:hypothetical protein